MLEAAARAAGLDCADAELIRDGSNVMYRLRGQIVARIGRPGSGASAEREVALSRWLNEAGLPAVRTVTDVPQAIVVADRPVTWWAQLPEHRAATPAELGGVLRELHDLPVPASLRLPTFDPFAGLEDRIEHGPRLTADERAWLGKRLSQLREQHRLVVLAEHAHVIHGDAWQGNVAVPESGRPILLDLEHVSIGHAEWDLIQLGVDCTDFARLTAGDYQAFVTAYGGYDVTTTPAFRTLADIQELRWACFVLSKSARSAEAEREAHHRIACLRGDVPRPWRWAAF